MTISQLIQNLTDFQEEFGDILVTTTDYETSWIDKNWDDRKYLCFGIDTESKRIVDPIIYD